MNNLMDTLTPTPPFDPKRKNQAVKFPPFPASVGKTAANKVLKGSDRTVYSIKL